jgi:hypothetical protein
METKVGVIVGVGVEAEKIDISRVKSEINWLKLLLNIISKQYNFDLQHPHIQALSQRLDQLILIDMKSQSFN